MSEHGAALQHQFQELVSMVENLKKKRFNLQKLIEVEKEKKYKIEEEIEKARIRVTESDKKLTTLTSALADVDSTIAQSEEAFTKILENAELLLAITRKTGGELDKIM